MITFETLIFNISCEVNRKQITTLSRPLLKIYYYKHNNNNMIFIGHPDSNNCSAYLLLEIRSPQNTMYLYLGSYFVYYNFKKTIRIP